MNLVRRNAVLAVLAVVLAVPTALQLRRDADTFVDLATVPLLYDGFTADTAQLITIALPKKEQPVPEPSNPNAPKVAYDQLTMQRTEKGWVVAPGHELAGAPISKERVENDVFAHLRAIRADREVMVRPNATPEQLEAYGLDEKQAFVVRVTDATPLRPTVLSELMVGKDAGAGQTGTDAVRGVFVRKSDSTDVILYEFDKGWRRDVQLEGWLDKVLARLEPDKVKRLALRNTATGGQPVTFARLDGKASWQAVDPPAGVGAVRQTEVENLVQRLRWIAAQDFRVRTDRAGNLAALGLAPGRIEIDLGIQEADRERTLRLVVGNQVDGKNEYYLMTTEPAFAAFVMTWPAGAVTPFEVDPKAQLFDPAPPEEKPADQPAVVPDPGKDKKSDK
jgi:hypothetical protein